MSALYEKYLDHPFISTDTRRIRPDSLFFALRGASFDGNRFAEEALAKGAAYAVVDDASVVQDERYILVEDSLSALQALAREHRRALGIPILAVAGSNGKTTTKELVSRVLAQKFRLYATQGNLNNHIGVPLTLLAMDRTIEFGVVEMGASAQGEIATLCAIAEPNFGILTYVGRAHLEGFGGVEGVRKGKGELFDYLNNTKATSFVREEDSVICSMAEERPSLRVNYYSEQLAEGIPSHLEGAYNRYNIAAAVAIGRYFGVEEEKIRAAIGGYNPDNNRSQREERAHNTLIVDCYNANPSSMQASINHFLSEPLGQRSRRLLILGDMRELGAWSKEEHQRILKLFSEEQNTTLWLVGEEFKKAFNSMGEKPANTTLYDS
ncbi:MAG: UDP-N-acetylmuramoyl-tripeptide--D-alanyl-D-alanine ligase, partial [Alistipes sp.]|nr:UDP-N-acetylmuramoyl-tripeptide--D-alanyl-D-alanine ligase [Alistipes sp.]